VSAQYHTALHAVGDGGTHDVLRAQHVGTNCLHWIELARGHLLQCGRVEHVVHVSQGIVNTIIVADVTDIEFHTVVLQSDSHVFLLLFVATKNTDLGQVGIKEAPEHRVSKRSGSSSDQ